MNEHTLCCGTVADKAKLCAEIEKRDSVIRAQQRRISELLQERDEALAYAERLRGALNQCVHAVENTQYGWDGDCGVITKISVIVDYALDEQPPAALAALKEQWQAEALENAIKELSYCGYDGQAWASELEQYALKLRTQEPN